MAALREILNRYIDRCVTVQSYGYRRYIGKVAAVTDEIVVLKNATALDDYEGSRWDDESLHWRVKEEVDAGFAETVLAISSIVAVTSSDNEGLEPIEKEVSLDGMRAEVIDPISEPQPSTDEPHYDAIEIRLGCEIIHQIRDGVSELVERIGRVRQSLEQDLGFAFPRVRIRDDLRLDPNQYSILVAGTPRGGNHLQLDKLLVVGGPEHLLSELNQPIFTEPAFGLPAIWLPPENDKQAFERGLVPVSCTTAIVTHLQQIVLHNLTELYSYEVTNRLLYELSVTVPALYQEYLTGYPGRSRLHELFLALLADGVYLKPIQRIAEVAAFVNSDSTSELVDRVRLDTVNSIVRHAVDPLGRATRIDLSSEISTELPQIEESEELSNRLRIALLQFARENGQGRAFVLVVPYYFRKFFSKLLADFRSLVIVISDEEYSRSTLNWRSIPFSVDTLCGIGSSAPSTAANSSIERTGGVASRLED